MKMEGIFFGRREREGVGAGEMKFGGGVPGNKKRKSSGLFLEGEEREGSSNPSPGKEE